ncbi:MAG: hypothetical protein AAB393_16555 [Bacteroidota bacterium]
MKKLAIIAFVSFAFASCAETPAPAVPTPAADMVSVSFMVRDGRDDKLGQYVWFYDKSMHNVRISGPTFLRYYNKHQEIQVRCIRGHEVCLGAVQGSIDWGCSRGCVKYCANCCRICTEATYSFTLR